MAKPLIFLSHIHEEKDLADLIKQTIEEEFAGFVDVFVSSNSKSNPAGAKFLSAIENGLTQCVGAIFLISPMSVQRPWINFELGAVWVRSTINLKNLEKEIPAIPFCHSGITPSNLPMPLNNLNAIACSVPGNLRSAFQSLQTALGTNSTLRTNFDNLAEKIKNIEETYVVGDRFRQILNLFGVDFRDLKRAIQNIDKHEIEFPFDNLNQEDFDKIRMINRGLKSELFDIRVTSSGTGFTNVGTINFVCGKVIFSTGSAQKFL